MIVLYSSKREILIGLNFKKSFFYLRVLFIYIFALKLYLLKGEIARDLYIENVKFILYCLITNFSMKRKIF